MKIKSIYLLIVFGMFGVTSSCRAADDPNLQQTNKLGFLTCKGTAFVNEAGKEVILKGCNIGSWLNLEMWMLDVKDPNIPDQYTYEKILEDRFEKAQRQRLMDLFRENWITERDFQIIKSFGFNCVRVPFHYNIIEDDDNPMQLKKDAWRWLDRAVELAKNYDMYVILDLHSVAGCQNNFDHSGRKEWNKFWSDQTYWKRTEWLWEQIAEHYKNNPTIAAYQPINEPWGGTLEQQTEIFDRLYKAIRKFDKTRPVIASAHYTGFDHFGDPNQHGWVNVGFSQNFYPGLFGSAARPESHRGFFMWLDNELAPKLQKLNIPFLVTEFNVVFKKAGGAQMMRRHYDEYAKHKWAAVMWSYKLITSPGRKNTGGWWLITDTGLKKTGNYGMITNKEPLPAVNLHTAGPEEIEVYLRSLSTSPYEIDEELRSAVTAIEKPAPLVETPAVPMKAVPYHDEFSGWTATDVNGALPGGQKVNSDTAIDLYAGGADIWAYNDQLRFVWKKIKGDFEISAAVDSLAFTDMYSKAGLMLRQSLDPNSAYTTTGVQPDGNVELLVREKTGAHGSSWVVMGTEFPDVRLKLVRKGKIIQRFYAQGDMPWDKFDEIELPDLPDEAYAGVFALSHDNSQLTKAVFRNIKVTAAGK